MQYTGLTELFRTTPFLVNGVRVEPSALQLSSPQGDSILEPKVMALLVLLSESSGELCRRSELMDRIWPGHQSSDECLTRIVSVLRRILKTDHGISAVTTVPKLGYRLDAEVRKVEESAAVLTNTGAAPSQAEPTQILPHTLATIARRQGKRGWAYIFCAVIVFAIVAALQFRGFEFGLAKAGESGTDRQAYSPLRPSASVAVLPIASMTRNKSISAFAGGMMQDLTAQLSRISSIHVAPYHSARVFVDEVLAAAADRLGVRYIVSGTLTETPDRLDLRVDLTDTKLGVLVWSKRYSEPSEHFFKLRDPITKEIAITIFFKIQNAEIDRIRDTDSLNPSVYELIQKAEAERKVYGYAAFKRIRQYLQRALELEPDNPKVLSGLAIQLTQGLAGGFSADPAKEMHLARQYLERARALAPRDSQVLASAGIVSFMTGETRQAERLLKMSLATDRSDPNEPHSAAVLGLIQCYLDQPEQGLALLRSSEARASMHPRYGVWAFYRGVCHYVQNDWVAASAALRDSIDRNPNYSIPYVHLAFVECMLGNVAKGRRIYRQALHIYPEYTLSNWMFSVDATKFPGTAKFSVAAMKQVAQSCLGDI